LEAIGNPGGRPADDPKTPIRSNPRSLDQREHRPSLYLLLLFLVLAAGIITAGYLFYRSYARNFRGEVERGLSSIAELKVGQLVQWRKERLMDASFLYRNPGFSALVSRYLRNPADAGAHDGLQAWLENYIGYYQYDRAFLLDARGVERMSAPETPNRIASIISRRTSEILRSGQPVIQDFYRSENDGKIYLSVLAPIFDEQERDLPLGVVVLLIDPATYLYPFIQQWPAPSRTAETLLVRREGDEALFLNELRFRKNSALNLRVPLDKGDVPAVKAALGQKGIVEGVDYRGVPVVADVRGIPDSPWFLVARMDTTEAFKPMRERRWLIIGLVAVLLFGAGTGAGLIWRQQRLRFFRERLAAAETLRLSYERFLLANRATYNAIWDWDLRTNALWWNENFQTLFGYGAEEIELGIESWTKRIHPEDLERVQTGIHETIDSGRHSWSDQYRVRRKDGRYAVVDDRGHIVRQADGSPVRMIGAMQDITERMQAEEKLRESEEKYRAFIETNQEWIWQINNEGIHTYSNPAIEQILGYSIEDIVGKNAMIHMHPEDRREIEEMLPKWIENKKGWNNLVLRWLHKDGSIRWLESNAVMMLDVNGELIGFQGSDRDITARKRADEAVRKSEEKYRGLTENVNLGIYRNTVGPEGKFIEANPALVGMFEYKSKEEFLAINVSDLYQNAEGRNKFNDKMLKEGFVRGEELWLRKADGSLFIGSVSAVAVKDEQGHVKYYDGIIDDITERKRAEEALRASLREKEVLLREVHHRVKNNMQVISSLFNLQAEYTTNEECRGILKEGQARIRSMSLVHEKLYQSRDMSKIDLADYIQGLAAHLFHVYLINSEQVRMETEFEELSLDINSAVPCGLILNELISNAFKHAFPEGRTGVIKIGLRRGPGGAVELRVADDGVGFPKGLDFRKAESFGLQIVNLLVDQLEATIEIDRTKGTAFTVTFHELKYAPRI
jgi:PAS domain S-box-containing protein